MKAVYAKFNDDRQKERAFVTTLYVNEQGDISVATKEALYLEGRDFLARVVSYQDKLKTVFSDVQINKTWIEDDRLFAEFVNGTPLTELYLRAAKANNKQDFFDLFNWHIALAQGRNNQCKFTITKEFESVFGSGAGFVGSPALGFTNFDAVSENILLINGTLETPCFIDYEWCFDCPVPVALLTYHIIQVLYQNQPDLQDFVDIKELQNYAFSKGDDIVELEKTWKHTSTYLIDEQTNMDQITARYYQGLAAPQTPEHYLERQKADQEKLNVLNEYITNMRNSNSWRLTKPLRAFTRKFKNDPQ